MKITTKYPSKTTVKLTVNLDKKEIEAAESVALATIARDLKVAGFRKGKVPIHVAKKHADPMMLQEKTLENALSKAVAEAFLQEKIQAIQRPEVDVKKFVPGQELEFTAEAQIIPEITLPKYTNLKAKKTVERVSAKEVDEIIERMRQNFVEKKEATRAAKKGDEAVIDFVGKKDGVAFDGGSATNYPLKLGDGQFIPGFEEGVIGHKKGDAFDLELEFPKDYHAKELAGQKVVFSVTLHAVNELHLPEVNDEFAAKCGPFTDVKALKEDIKREITAKKEHDATEKYKDALIAEVAKAVKVDLPELLVEDQIRSIEQDMTQNLAYRGMTIDTYLSAQNFKDRDEWVKKEVRPAAEERVKAGLVLAELSKDLKIDISREELDAQISAMKQQYGAKDPSIAKQFDNPNVHRDIANRMITDKTIEKLVELNS